MLVNTIRMMQACQRSRDQAQIAKGQSERSCVTLVDSDAFRQPVVRSGGAVRRPAAPPRRTPFPEVESLVALVSPSPRKDASSIGDSNRNTTSGFVVTSFHGTRSHDRGTHGERSQLPVRHRLAAKVSAV